ncbi:hypothetical protein BV25DRAFT_1955412 [Artomyces pyxidatus]|uniref:Uncharacterized protein n=1 Tax=Artomyces pyxidatus TaxID=48021 RepID=A0ACB8SEE9_9AGAM|nr:hypothetical protein BV25DRAFT_1955412 [Artomyces pyxidatus]
MGQPSAKPQVHQNNRGRFSSAKDSPVPSPEHSETELASHLAEDKEKDDLAIQSDKYDDEWQGIGEPLTWDEHVEQKQEQAARIRAQQQAAQRRRAELILDGRLDKVGGAKDKTGTKRGPYRVGGDSERSARRKRQRMRETICCFFCRAQRYMSIYELGATGIAAEYAVKKYKSHTGVSVMNLYLAS